MSSKIIIYFSLLSPSLITSSILCNVSLEYDSKTSSIISSSTNFNNIGSLVAVGENIIMFSSNIGFNISTKLNIKVDLPAATAPIPTNVLGN